MSAELDISPAITSSVFPGNTKYGIQAAVDVGVGGGPGADTDSHGRLSLPNSPAAPASPVCLDFRNDSICGFAVSKLNQHLVEDYLIQ